jgi:histidinol-phosphate aminotransferase
MGVDMGNQAVSFTELSAAGVQNLKPYEPGKPIGEVRREYGLDDVIKLASNENPWGPSPRAVEAIRETLGGLAVYPDGNGFELKQALAARHRLGAERMTLGNGTDNIFELIALVFLARGRNAIISRHAFGAYALVIRAAGGDVRVAEPLPAHSSMPYGHDLDAIRALIDSNTRVVFIANPNNPTGTWLSADAMRQFLQNVPREVIVVVDEAYFEYVQEHAYPDCSQWLDLFPNLVVTRTFSKAYGLAGLRIGYGLSSPEIADLLNRVRQPFNTSSLAQAAAVAALDDREHIEKTVRLNEIGRTELTTAFDRLGLDYLPGAGNFLTVNVGRPAAKVFEALLKRGVIVRAIANYGFPNHLRITIGRPEQNQRLIAALEAVLRR